jgi:2-keto-3-deoxy-L-rhamnonate aldolase RhmA
MAIDNLPTLNRGNRFLEELENGGTPLGMFVFSPDVSHTEALGLAGFHLAVVDMEHAPLGIGDVLNHVRAAGAVGVSCWARVGDAQLGEIGRLLDCGAQGVMLPHFGLDRARCKAVIDAFRYAPKGNRGTCTAVRSVDHGLGDFASYAQRSDREAMAVGLIEDAAVVENIEAVLAGCGLDAVVPGGPGDLATSLGLPGQGTHPRVQAAVRRIVEAAKAVPRLKVGMYISEPAQAPTWARMGVDFFICSIDYRIMSRAFKQAHDTLREALPARQGEPAG